VDVSTVAGFIVSLKVAVTDPLIATLVAPGEGARALATGGAESTVSLPQPVIPTKSKAAKNPVIPSLFTRICICISSQLMRQMKDSQWPCTPQMVTNGAYLDARWVGMVGLINKYGNYQ
jgi:hypothetical protein